MSKSRYRLTKKYRLALETAQLHGIRINDREQLYVELQKHFTWYPALKRWLSNDRYFREEWGIISAFQPMHREKAQEQGLYTLAELHERAKIPDENTPDAVIRWTGSIDQLFHIRHAKPHFYKHPQYRELPCFRFWKHIPDHLKTKTQIQKTDKKRRPKQQPKAVVDTQHNNRGGIYLLYDIRECLDKTPQSEKQKQTFERIRAAHTCKNCQQTGVTLSQAGLCPRCQKREDEERAFFAMLAQERNNAIVWAQELLQEGFTILDTETTGLNSDAKIVEIAMLDGRSGRVLLNTLVHPGEPIPEAASAIHGITDADVQDKPRFHELLPAIEQALIGTVCVIYNRAYDQPLLHSHGIVTKNLHFACAMDMYAKFYGEYSDYWENFKWQSLGAALEQCGLEGPGSAHRALDDCQATRAVVEYMARQKVTSMTKTLEKSEEK